MYVTSLKDITIRTYCIWTYMHCILDPQIVNTKQERYTDL